jgi:hypothetical protein
LAGCDVIGELKYSKHANIRARITRQLEDGIVIPYQEISSNLPVGKNLSTSYVFHVPKNACSGRYRLQMVYNYQVNPLRVISIPVCSNFFDVIASKTK